MTGLDGYLRARGVGRVFIAGLARGYGTDFFAADSIEAGYETFFIEDACPSITADATEAQTVRLRSAGICFVTSNELHVH